MRKSIRVKMILVFFSIILAFVLCNVLLNSTLFKMYYSQMKEQALVDNLQIVANYDFFAEDFTDKLLELEESRNLRILIADENFNTVFCSSNERETMRDFFRGWDHERQVEESWGSYTIGGQTHPGHSRAPYLTIYARVTKPYLFTSRSFLVAINTPVVAIEDGAQIANNFTVMVGIILLILGGGVTFIVGTSFASPIVRASYAADQVAHLNFDERLPIKSNDEIGRLSGSINNLSDQLRTKIEELSVANEQLRRELQHKQRVDDMRRNFISDVSHELKTPLAIILGYCEGLQMNVNSEEKEYYCSVIEDEAIRMSNLASRLLQLAELESGEMAPELSVFDLRELAYDRLSKLGLLLEERGISYHMECTASSTFVNADMERIEEVVNNLLANARNHTPDGGEISLMLTSEGDRITCTIRNTGSHIPEESMERIWDSFYKVDKARTRSYGGSGLGLKIVSTILTAHNASFGARNTDTGVEFYFTLKLVEPPELWDTDPERTITDE